MLRKRNRKLPFRLFSVLITFGLAMALSSGCASKPVVANYSGQKGEKAEADAAGCEKMKVAVIRFDNETAYGKTRLGENAADIFTAHLVKSGRFIVIERERIKEVLEEQALGDQGAVMEEEAATLGKLLGVDTLFIGSVSEFGVKTETTAAVVAHSKKQTARAVVTLRGIDATSGQVVFAEQGEGVAVSEATVAFGFGKQMGYDETLAGKALNEALGHLITRLIAALKPPTKAQAFNTEAGEKQQRSTMEDSEN